MSKKSKYPKREPLTPPDRKQCQGEKPNGHTFLTLGGVPGHVRCTSKPWFIATERRPGKDGRKGKMSLCPECLAVLHRQLGTTYATLAPIKENVPAAQLSFQPRLLKPTSTWPK